MHSVPYPSNWNTIAVKKYKCSIPGGLCTYQRMLLMVVHQYTLWQVWEPQPCAMIIITPREVKLNRPRTVLVFLLMVGRIVISDNHNRQNCWSQWFSAGNNNEYLTATGGCCIGIDRSGHHSAGSGSLLSPGVLWRSGSYPVYTRRERRYVTEFLARCWFFKIHLVKPDFPTDIFNYFIYSKIILHEGANIFSDNPLYSSNEFIDLQLYGYLIFIVLTSFNVNHTHI